MQLRRIIELVKFVPLLRQNPRSAPGIDFSGKFLSSSSFQLSFFYSEIDVKHKCYKTTKVILVTMSGLKHSCLINIRQSISSGEKVKERYMRR